MDNPTETDNDYAFACASEHGYQSGMKLRDYFAGQALAGLRSQSLRYPSAYPIDAEPWTPDEYAKMAYKLADAMLKAREVKPLKKEVIK